MKEIELKKFVQIVPEHDIVDENGIPTGQRTEKVKLWGSFFDEKLLPEIILNTVCDNGITSKIFIQPSWTFKNTTNTVLTAAQAGVPNPNANSISVETGTKVTFTGKWKWQETTDLRNPTRTAGLFGTTLPDKDTLSAELVKEDIVSNWNGAQYIYCIKAGPVVSGTKLVKPSGEHAASVAVSVAFMDKAYIGQIDTLTPDQTKIKALTSRGLVNNKVRNESGVTNDNTHYWCYAYPKSLGMLSKIIMNGATPVLGAFITKEVTVTNGSGNSVPYICYITSNKGAFTNAQLAFS